MKQRTRCVGGRTPTPPRSSRAVRATASTCPPRRRHRARAEPSPPLAATFRSAHARASVSLKRRIRRAFRAASNARGVEEPVRRRARARRTRLLPPAASSSSRAVRGGGSRRGRRQPPRACAAQTRWRRGRSAPSNESERGARRATPSYPSSASRPRHPRGIQTRPPGPGPARSVGTRACFEGRERAGAVRRRRAMSGDSREPSSSVQLASGRRRAGPAALDHSFSSMRVAADRSSTPGAASARVTRGRSHNPTRSASEGYAP